MDQFTETLWRKQDRHPGDRQRLFAAIAEFTGQVPVLYAGSFVDIAPSFVFDDVTYVDSDVRAARFFRDRTGVDEIIENHRTAPAPATWTFIHSDYRKKLDLAEDSVGLLVSLYAGFVSEFCTRYLLPDGWLLANSSHGDVAMASLDPSYRLAAVVNSKSGRYTIKATELETYLVPKRPTEVAAATLHETGRGVAYTKSPFAYLFQRHAG